MAADLANLALQITRFVDEDQPGFVACEFVDASGDVHEIIEKVPIVSTDDLWFDTTYPLPGAARCVVLSRWVDENGRNLAKISIAQPDFLESTRGLEEFVVLQSQLSAST